MKHSSTGTLLIVVASLAVLAAAAFAYGIISINASRVRAAALAGEVREVEKKVAEIEAVQGALEEFKSYQEAVDAHLVSQEGIVEFVRQLEVVGRTAGISLNIDNLIVEQASPKPLPEIEYLRASFTGKGGWEALARFAALIEGMPFQVLVSNVTFSTDGTQKEGEESRLWTGSWSVLIPKLKEQL